MITLFGYAIIDMAIALSEALVLAGMGVAFIRLTLGPSLADRVIALDLLATLMVGYMALFAVLTGHAAFLDVAISVALVTFLATVAFARFVERQRSATAPAEHPDSAPPAGPPLAVAPSSAAPSSAVPSPAVENSHD